jgi:hypothetical protein
LSRLFNIQAGSVAVDAGSGPAREFNIDSRSLAPRSFAVGTFVIV